MAKQSQDNAGIKSFSTSTLIVVVGMITLIFAISLGFLGSQYTAWLPLVILLIFGALLIPLLFKTKIERYYDAVRMTNPDIKPLRRLKKSHTAEGMEFNFKMPVGMSKSQYQKFQEGLEQYLDSKVEFRFEHDLIIKVTEKPPDP